MVVIDIPQQIVLKMPELLTHEWVFLTYWASGIFTVLVINHYDESNIPPVDKFIVLTFGSFTWPLALSYVIDLIITDKQRQKEKIKRLENEGEMSE